MRLLGNFFFKYLGNAKVTGFLLLSLFSPIKGREDIWIPTKDRGSE